MAWRDEVTARTVALVTGIGLAFFTFLVGGWAALDRLPTLKDSADEWHKSALALHGVLLLIGCIVIVAVLWIAQEHRKEQSTTGALTIGLLLGVSGLIGAIPHANDGSAYIAGRFLVQLTGIIGSSVLVLRSRRTQTLKKIDPNTPHQSWQRTV